MPLYPFSSILLIASASLSENFSYKFFIETFSLVFNFRIPIPAVSDNAIRYSHSIRTLYFMEAASLKYGVKSLVYFSYRPSIGEIEFKGILYLIFFKVIFYSFFDVSRFHYERNPG